MPYFIFNAIKIINYNKLNQKAGANADPGAYQPTPTSYDYDAPISESGDLTDKYYAIKEVLKKYVSIPQIDVNSTSPKGDYGEVKMFKMPIHPDVIRSTSNSRVQTNFPLTFEAFGQDSGLVLYETTVKFLTPDPTKLEILGIHDRGYIFINGIRQGILSRMNSITSMSLSIDPGETLQILVENQGRVCFGKDINDFKGIVGNVTLNGHILEDWTMTGYPFSDPDSLQYIWSDLTAKKHFGKNWDSKSFQSKLR